MREQRQLIAMVVILALLGMGAVAYKHFVLGFPLVAGAKQFVWSVEAKINFTAEPERDIEVNLNAPDLHPDRKTTFSRQSGRDFDFELETHGNSPMARWRSSERSGRQTVYFVVETSFDGKDVFLLDAPAPELAEPSFVSEIERTMSTDLLASIEPVGVDTDSLVRKVLTTVNLLDVEQSEALLRGARETDRLTLVINLLAMKGITAHIARGVPLQKQRRAQAPVNYLEVYDGTGKGWRVYEPRAENALSWSDLLLFSRGEESLYEVFGGVGSSISFALVKERRSRFETALDAGLIEDNPLLNFSIYTLPLEEQAAFKLLLLIPVGALVVVILRNLVGLRTSGTFMPILIALTFLQTSLASGVTLFLLVVGVGLIMRSYLSHLNLLLVPRIAAVLVFVIVIYGAVGVIGRKLDLPWSSAITFFPMIILSWTIERMSILWEEDGWREVVIQGGGSLLSAVLAYFLMGNEWLADTIFMFPELLLVLLAIIIMIGSYSGYRLSDLRRFEPMERF